MKGEREFKGTVVHLVPAMDQGGVERVVCNLNRAALRAGWRSVVISRGGRLVEQIVADGGEHVALDLKSKNPLTYLARAWKLRKVIRGLGLEGRRDENDQRDESDAKILVCAHSRVPAWLYVGARKIDSLVSLPWITYAHGANSVSRYSAVMTRGDRVVVPSKFLAGYLIENYAGDGTPASKTLRERIRVIYPAVDFEKFDPAKVDAAAVAVLRREWGVCDGERVVMSIGRITALKGFDNVIRDFAGGGAPASKTADKLIIVGGVDKGKESLLDALKKLAAELGVADRVVFAGARSDIPACLMVADEVVSGNVTKPESFGLSVAEALAMGKPVRLLRNFGGAGEILKECGRRSARRQNADAERREAIRSLCDFDIMWQQTEKVYEELLK